MKAFVGLCVVLLVSLVCNAVLIRYAAKISEERDKALAEIKLLDAARKADAAAIATYEKVRTDAAATAQGRRDALQSPHADTDDDVLRVCRGGLCAKSGTGGADTAAGASDAVPTPGNAGGAYAR